MERLLTIIKELVDLYNDLPNVKKVALVPEEYTKEMNTSLGIISEEAYDSSTYYICLYDKDRVGLFRELRYSSPKE